jgi:DNA-binding NtrC family response regulator
MKPSLDKLSLISNDPDSRNAVKKSLISSGISIIETDSPSEALKLMETEYPGFVVLTHSAGIPASVFARRVHGSFPATEIITFGFEDPAVGADVNIVPGTPQDIIALRINKVINDQLALRKCGMSGRSSAIKEAANSILAAAATDLTILVTGPSGVGKELAARAIHNNSKRSDRQFISVNCGALTEGVLSSELFGHERGSFTGAVAQKKGVFESAADGTIFLDEIGEISAETQVKLLRVLEDGSFYRVGGNKMLKSNARVVTATNRDLLSEVNEGNFRQDLFYRLRVMAIHIPPLKDRPEDIAVLAERFISDFGAVFHQIIAPDVLDIMARHDWPGNGRELRNFIESRLALSDRNPITRRDVENYITETGYQRRHLPVSTGVKTESAEHQLIIQALVALREEIIALKKLIRDNIPDVNKIDGKLGEVLAEWRPDVQVADGEEKLQSVSDAEREAISAALKQFEGNRRKAAQALGIGERTLYRKIAKYGLS